MNETLTWFLLAAKPEWVRSLDVAVVAHLLARSDAAGSCRPKLAEMAAACGVAQIKSVRESLQRLIEHGWVTSTHISGIGQPNEYTVLVDKLPRWDQQILNTGVKG